jgi:hypothetical protein
MNGKFPMSKRGEALSLRTLLCRDFGVALIQQIKYLLQLSGDLTQDRLVVQVTDWRGIGLRHARDCGLGYAPGQ